MGGQFNLGLMYENGRGVPKDNSEAAHWYRNAARQGTVEAQFNLGVSYANGQGVPQDLVYAHKWLNLAGSQGLEEAQENRRTIERQMTRGQIAEAQRLAHEWMREFESRAEEQ